MAATMRSTALGLKSANPSGWAPAEFERLLLYGAIDDWLGTIPYLLVFTVLTLGAYILSWLCCLRFTGVQTLVNLHNFLAWCLVFHCLAIRTMYVKYFKRPKMVFVCFSHQHVWDYMQPIMGRASWFWKDQQMLISELSWKGRVAGYVCVIPPYHVIKNDPAMIQYHLESCLHAFKGAKIALCCHLPAIARQMGLPAIFHQDVVNSRVGTMALARRGVQKGLEWLQSSFPQRSRAHDRKMCILDGDGLAGKEIVEAFTDLFSTIFIINSEFASGDCILTMDEGATVIGSSDHSCLGDADLVFVFLPEGSSVEPYVGYANRYQIWIDNSHPGMTQEMCNKLLARTHVTRLAAYSQNVGMWPKLPGWKPQHLPGCLLTAQLLILMNVELQAGSCMATARMGRNGVTEFIQLAEELGIELGIFPVKGDEEFEFFGVDLVSSESKKDA